MRQDKIDTAGFEVWARVRAGQPLTMALCHQVIAESGSTANAQNVYFQVRQWQAETTRTRRLGRR